MGGGQIWSKQVPQNPPLELEGNFSDDETC